MTGRICPISRVLMAGAGIVAALGLVACDGSLASENKDDSPSAPSGGDSAQPECQVAADCVAAASTCCECPSFAISAASGYQDDCDGVGCQPEAGCPALEAACDNGTCVLQCQAVVTDQICSTGFARDSAGCLLDQCDDLSDGEAAECQVDEDCTQAPADCCGCAQGGSDTAVPVDQVNAFTDALSCPQDPACPGVDVCDASVVPRCLSGFCALGAPDPDAGASDGGPLPPEESSSLCGTPAFPLCPEGQVCVLNAPGASDANELGVGHCQAD